jgi:DNA-binding GntR family transcriptional regulator
MLRIATELNGAAGQKDGTNMSTDLRAAEKDRTPVVIGQEAKPAIRRIHAQWDWAPDLNKARAYEQILLGIVIGELAPGERLDERALVERYAVGLAGVRDALGRLALESLVVRRPRAGTTVAPLDLMEVDEAFEARRLIEPHCAALAAEKATADDICAIRGAFADAEPAIRANDSRALVAMDQRFHAAIAKASRNATLARIVIPMQHKATRYWVYSMGNDTIEDRLAEIDLHRAVGDCIARHDAKGAYNAMLVILGGDRNQPAVTPGKRRRAPVRA